MQFFEDIICYQYVKNLLHLKYFEKLIQDFQTALFYQLFLLNQKYPQDFSSQSWQSFYLLHHFFEIFLVKLI